MRIKLTLRRPGEAGESDVAATFDASVTIGALAEALTRRDPSRSSPPAGDVAIRVEGSRPLTLAGATTVVDSGLRSGQVVSVVADPGVKGPTQSGSVVAELVVAEGPEAGRRFPLRLGANYIGRDRSSDVRLSDPLVSKRHARISVSDVVEIVDLGAANGVAVGGDTVSRALLRPTDPVVLGDTVAHVQFDAAAVGTSSGREGVAFNRSPSLSVDYPDREVDAPEPPDRPGRQRFPWVPMIAPILMGCVLFALTRQVYSVIFVALSPVMALGNIVETRFFAKKAFAEAEAAHEEAVTALRDDLARGRADEAASRLAEHPSTADLVSAALVRSPLLWTRRPDRSGFLDVRVGVGRLASRTSVKLPRPTSQQSPVAWAELRAIAEDFASIADVPAVVSLREVGSLGVAGRRSDALALARALIAGLVANHSPAEASLAIATSSEREADWQWSKWLPHVGDDYLRLGSDHLSSSPGAVARLVAALEELVTARAEETADGTALPAVVLVVDDAPLDRSRLVELAERGPRVGVHLVWVAGTVALLPAACRAFVEVDGSIPTQGTLGLVENGWKGRIELERLGADEAMAFARELSPVVDAGARVDDASDLPRTVSLLSLLGTELGRDAASVSERWNASAPAAGRKRASHLRAVVGSAVGQAFSLDLREHGPHALVGGTTGSGKSEFLQSWVMAMAAEHSPSRLTFLFVDYKGGAAFGECVNLPHSVGLVTDLSPHLVQRALISLNAELRHREHLLQAKKAKDLVDLEGDPEAPPRLVIVVDEFAALVSDVPEFVDGVVNVAQRGRSLGLHLVLATQRPAGVIKDNLRANTNLRIALRVADEDDSRDVVGTPQAAAFDPSLPGRGVAKTGPGRLMPFQAGYVGGWTSDQPDAPVIVLEELPFGVGRIWEEPEPAVPEVVPDPGPNDLHRLVATIGAASEQLGIPKPRRPWLPELAAAYDLARLPQSRTDSELVFAVLDDPENQRQVPVAFHPDRDGNMAVIGTGGTGKTTTLRTLAISAGLATRSGPCHVYAVDFAGRGLSMLSELPHVGSVVSGDDHERLTRLLRWLRALIDQRSIDFAKVHAGDLSDFRTLAKRPDEPRMIVLIDGMAAFRAAYDVGDRVRWLDLLNGLATDGRQVGVHFVVSADRTTSIPPALSSAIQRRLVLRMANDQDYAMADIDHPEVLSGAPAGRGLLGDDEIQVAVLGGTSNVQLQAQTIKHVAGEMNRTISRAEPSRIGRLSDRVTLGELPATSVGLPTLGLADDTLGPIGFSLDDPLLVTGSGGSGVTSTLATLTLSLLRAMPDALAHFIGSTRSPLHQLSAFTGRSAGYDVASTFIEDLVAEINGGKLLPGRSLVVVEDLGDVMAEGLDGAVVDLVRACAAQGVAFVTHVDPSIAGGFSQLLQTLRAKRHGLALQPEQHEGDQIFKTTFPRINRSEFPPGRGFYVRKGVVTRVQVALPDVEG